MRHLLAGAGLVLATLTAGPARADVPPPPGLARLAAEPGFVDRFMAAALDGPPYFNGLMARVDPGRLARMADAKGINYFAWRGFDDEEPPVIGRIRALTGLGENPDVSDPDYDSAVFVAVEERDVLSANPPRGPGIEAPFHTTTDPDVIRGAVCGVFAASENPLKPRELSAVTVHVLASAPAADKRRCLSRVLLRGFGLKGMGEYAGGLVPADADPENLLTPEEEAFLWLAYRLPLGTEAAAMPARIAEILAGL